MEIKKISPENEMDILLVALLDDLIEKSNYILTASAAGRVDEKEVTENVCKKIIEISGEIKAGKKKGEEGLESILSELNIIRNLAEEGKINPRSLVSDQHLIMEARIKDMLLDVD